MAGSALTVFELEADGFTHISCWCEGCRENRQLELRSLRYRVNFVVASMTLDQLRQKLSCNRCPDRPNPASIQPWRQPRGPLPQKRGWGMMPAQSKQEA
jgi:hypothetical protein